MAFSLLAGSVCSPRGPPQYGVFNALWFLFCLFLLLLEQNVIPVDLPSATFGDAATKVLSENVSDVPVTVVVIVIYALNGFLAVRSNSRPLLWLTFP